MDKLIDLMAPTLVTLLNVKGVLLAYAVCSTICVYFLKQRIKLLKEENAFSEIRRTAALESLAEAVTCRGSDAEGPSPNVEPVDPEYDILLIDDEEAILSYKELIEQRLRGSRVRTAKNAEQALREIELRTPSIIITDMVMPIMDGHALLKKLAHDKSGVPVIAISAYINRAEEITAGLCGTPLQLTFLPKPFTTKKLLEAIHEASKRRRRFRRWLWVSIHRGRMLKASKKARIR